MNVNRGLMDVFFGYNMRVGDVDCCKQSAIRYQQMSQNAETPEERERYANAVTKINDELLPKFQQEVNAMGKQLGLNDDEIGLALTKKALEEKEDKKSQTILEYLEGGIPSYLSSYQPGNIFSKDI